MASLIKDDDTRYRVSWKCPLTGVRRTLRMGKMDGKTAKAAVVRIERLIGSIATGEEPDSETRTWIRNLSPTLTNRLANVGLLGRSGAIPSGLDAFIRHLIATRSHGMAKGTQGHWELARREAVEFYGDKKDIRTITTGDAVAFSHWLRTARKTKKRTKSGNIHASMPLNESTAGKRCATLSAMFAAAVDHELIGKNPFADKKISKRTPPAPAERRFFLRNEDALRILDELTDPELRAMFALCRWGGLRVGETLLLTWDLVHFGANDADGKLTVLSPKTARKGKPQRTLPLFPELRRVLVDLHLNAPTREPRLLPHFATKTTQWGAQSLKLAIQRAGLTPWVRLWQNLRGTRATELADHYPSHLCAEWLGHTEDVANENYRRATHDHYRTAALLDTATMEAKWVAQIPAHPGAETPCTARNDGMGMHEKAPAIPGLSE